MDIPDVIDTEKDDKNMEKIREENKIKKEEVKEDDTKKGKCACFIF